MNNNLSLKLDQNIQPLTLFIRIMLSWRSIITFGCCVIAALVYDNMSWKPLQIFIAKLMAGIFEIVGYSVIRIDDILNVESYRFHFINHCTYANGILIGIPFMWWGRKPYYDILRIILFIVVVSIINVVRIYFLVVLTIKGIPWIFAHTLPIHVISWSIFISIFLLWLKAMKLLLCKENKTIIKLQRETTL